MEKRLCSSLETEKCMFTNMLSLPGNIPKSFGLLPWEYTVTHT